MCVESNLFEGQNQKLGRRIFVFIFKKNFIYTLKLCVQGVEKIGSRGILRIGEGKEKKGQSKICKEGDLNEVIDIYFSY